MIKVKPIVVEGERTQRTIAETASSVAVVTGEQLQDIAGPNNLETAFRQVTNVIMNGKSNLAVTIRGNDTTGILSGVDSFFGGARPRTTVQLDGRPMTYFEYIFGGSSTWDVQRVEIFRGPQTTTQGRNSIAGAIFLETNDPTYDYEIRGRALAGNFDTQQYSGVISGPLLEDQVAARITFDVRDHESFLTLQGLSPGVADDPTEDNYRNVRGKLLFEPSAIPDLSTMLIFSYTGTKRPQTELVDMPFENRTRNMNPNFAVFETESYSLTLNADYSISNELEMLSTFTYSDSDIQRLSPTGTGNAEIDNKQYVAEAVLDYSNDNAGIQGLLGVSALVSHQDDMIDLNLYRAGMPAFTDDQESLGIFGEVTWTPFDPFDLTVGLRYQRDHQDRAGGQGTPFIAAFDKTFDAILPTFGLAYRAADNVTVGATVKRGFNPGGFTVTFFPLGMTDTFNEEYVWNYEAYWRSSWWDDRLSFNGNIFLADYQDQQRPATTIVMGMPVTEYDNAEEAHSYGLELDARFMPNETLELYGSLGLLETEIRQFTRSTGLRLDGKEFQRAPTMTSTFGLRYEPLQGLVLSGQGQYVDDYFSDDENNPELEVDDYFVANAQLAYSFSNVRVFAAVTNIFDEFYEFQSLGSIAQVGDPREYYFGVEVLFP